MYARKTHDQYSIVGISTCILRSRAPKQGTVAKPNTTLGNKKITWNRSSALVLPVYLLCLAELLPISISVERVAALCFQHGTTSTQSPQLGSMYTATGSTGGEFMIAKMVLS